MLPVPRSDVSVKRILRYWSRHRDELLHLRERLDELQRELAAADDHDSVQAVLARFSNSLELGLNELARRLREESIPTLLGSIRSLINVKSPTAVASAVALVAPLAGVHVPAAPFAIPLLAGTGAVEVAYHLVGKRNERRAAMRASPFTYLYQARDLLV